MKSWIGEIILKRGESLSEGYAFLGKRVSSINALRKEGRAGGAETKKGAWPEQPNTFEIRALIAWDLEGPKQITSAKHVADGAADITNSIDNILSLHSFSHDVVAFDVVLFSGLLKFRIGNDSVTIEISNRGILEGATTG